MVFIPCPGQVQLFPPHTEYWGMESTEISVKDGKYALNQQKLPREKEKTSKHNIYTLSKQSQAVSTTYKIFGYGKPWELYQKRKCTLNQQKLCREKRRDIWIWWLYLVLTKSNCPHYIQNIWAWRAQKSLSKMEKCVLNQQKLPRKKKKKFKYNIHTLSRQSQAVSTIYIIFEYGKLKGLCQKRKMHFK